MTSFQDQLVHSPRRILEDQTHFVQSHLDSSDGLGFFSFSKLVNPGSPLWISPQFYRSTFEPGLVGVYGPGDTDPRLRVYAPDLRPPPGPHRNQLKGLEEEILFGEPEVLEKGDRIEPEHY